MQNRLRFQTLDSYLVAKEIAKLVHLARIKDNELREQELLSSAL